ncbi:MAG: efflux RND transporter periplasmic adaptor subunit [Candidatus Omnitrophica bacterium]|jgi:macrolide-specific efflux system membrane fusion protein|nr:efflux RND transporter periplasmic adaptor subunit [Candidatus Omnitrophota bacterium]MDD3275092.1 efflux RND transporter periplasmic adaptor subunit [Candidatus Omnitrophota bacterium]MDD5078418.1 efflux RND transporter periplasmic adaptor subunit [Candidatus Omnitrophota bacterium]MDD5725574.1 efflux RND transporter periplasmic adaptor subunit [Candidatus Omnitrophota bacterium]
MFKKRSVLFIAVLLLAGAGFFGMKMMKAKDVSDTVKEIHPFLGSIKIYISTTGTVYPKNRLEIMPPVSGRVESVLVKEGENVKIGQTLAWMSSTERAALLDAARGQGDEKLKYWQEVYKPIALLAPINGEVIVATTQPGQTVTTSDAVLVLSDKLIVRAQVDETDIGKIKLGQKAVIALDAYPDTKIDAFVEHIYYESETVNNVTIYKVDLVPENSPEFFRSGMNATVDFIVQEKDGILLIPAQALHKDNGQDYVLLKQGEDKGPEKRIVQVGITDDKNYEVLSGLTAADTVIITTKKYVFPSGGTTGSNPFLPKMPSAKKK